MAYGPLGGGILSDKYKTAPEFVKTDARRFFYRHFSPKNGIFEKSSALAGSMTELGSRHSATAAQCAIRWVLCHDVVTAALCGARSPEQITETAKAADIAIPLAGYAELKS